MNFFDKLLDSPRVSDHPKVLSLFGPPEPLAHALAEKGITVESFGETQSWERILHKTEKWDIVFAMSSMDRFYDTVSPEGLELFASWLQAHATVVISSPQKSVIDPERNSIGPTSLPEPFRDFLFFSEVSVSVRGQSPRTLNLLSDQLLWEGNRWIDLTEMFLPPSSNEGEKSPMMRRADKRTIILNDHTVIKIQAGSVDYFDLLEVNQEATVLETLKKDSLKALGIPRLVSVSRGKTLTMLHRDAVYGERLDKFPHVFALSQETILREILAICQKYAAHGLFHNDIRPWNLLSSERGVSLIDYSRISAFDSDSRNLPQILALWGTLIFFTEFQTFFDTPDFSERFDVVIMKQASNFLESRQISLDTLYGKPWRQLAGKDSFSLVSQLADPEDLLARLLGL